jgi:glycosyltransferase involved in cell wall biosynthesis
MLPHYGRLDLVQATIRTVLAQDDPNWRLTILDDTGESADDALAEWCAGLDDERVRYRLNPRNLGINRNFQQCIDLVEHELAVLVGNDDLMLPNYIGTVRRAHAAHPEAAIIQPGVEVVGAPRVTEATVFSGQELAVSLLRGNWLYFPSICWRSEPLRRTGFREGVDVVQDLALVLDLVLDGESLLVEPTTCFRYRRHDASVSSAHAADGRRFAEERAFFLETADRMTARGWPRAARAARRHLSSRINALTRLPAAARHGGLGGVRTLARHAFGG